MVDTTSPLLGLLLMGTGGDNNSWGINLNSSVITPIENAIAGVNTISGLTGGAYALSAANSGYATIILTGTLTSDLTITVPSTAKKWTFINNLADGGFYTLIKTAAGAAVNIPTGVNLDITCDGTNLYRADRNKIGELFHHAGTNPPAGSFECKGQTPLRASAVDLYAAIGTTWGVGNNLTTFTLPDGYTAGKFVRGRTASVPVGTYQANQNLAHTHVASASSVTGTTDSQGAHTHTATVNDPGHTHAVVQLQGGGIIPYVGGGTRNGGGGTNDTTTINQIMSIGSNTTGITVSNAAAGAHTHNVTGTAAAQSIASSGGAEARPEAIVGILCIRY